MKKFLAKFLALIIGLIIFSFIPNEEWTREVFVFYGVCIVLTSIIGHSIYKKYYWRAVLFTIIVSPIIFTMMFMWLIVTFMHGFLYTFPVALPASMIIGDIFNWYRSRKVRKKEWILVRILALIMGLVVFSLLAVKEGYKFQITTLVSIVLMSALAHYIFKMYWRAVLFTIIVFPIIFMIGYVIYDNLDNFMKLKRNLPDIIMWSPFIFVASFIQTLPITFPVSMIIGDIFKWYRSSKGKNRKYDK